MHKFWEKTKQSVALGINAYHEATGNSQLQETQAYTDLYNQIKEAGDKLNEIQKLVREYSKQVEKLTSVQHSLSAQIFSLFKPNENNYETAEAASLAQESMHTIGRNLSTHYIETYLEMPVKQLLDELHKVNVAISERKKDHVLLVSAEKDLEKAKEKGKIKECGEYQEIVITRRAKFTKSDNDFKVVADEFLTKAPEKYSEIFETYQSFVAEFFDEGRKQSIDMLPSFPYAAVKSKHPSITIAPAETPKAEQL